jgi:hypothetical protein
MEKFAKLVKDYETVEMKGNWSWVKDQFPEIPPLFLDRVLKALSRADSIEEVEKFLNHSWWDANYWAMLFRLKNFNAARLYFQRFQDDEDFIRAFVNRQLELAVAIMLRY